MLVPSIKSVILDLLNSDLFWIGLFALVAALIAWILGVLFLI
jgi:hypothetical protein